jgi:hypothetical protein
VRCGPNGIWVKYQVWGFRRFSRSPICDNGLSLKTHFVRTCLWCVSIRDAPWHGQDTPLQKKHFYIWLNIVSVGGWVNHQWKRLVEWGVSTGRIRTVFTQAAH